MSVHDDDLLPELRRSAEPADRRLARVLGRLTGDAPLPHASGELAAFLAEAESLAAPQAPPPVTDTVPLPADALTVRLGRTTPRSSPMRSRPRLSLNKILKTGLLAKVMLGTTVALTGVGAAAATGNLPGTGDDNVVVVTPADDSGSDPATSDDPVGVLDVDDQDEDDDAHDDEPGDDPDDQGEDADDQGDDDQDEADDAADNADQPDVDDDDQGEDGDDQGEDADEDADNSGPGGGDDADDDEPDDESGDGDEDSSGDEDSEGDDDGSGGED